MKAKTIENNFFFGLFLATFIFTFFIFKPFWMVLVLGVSFTIILYPVYRWFQARKFPNWLASAVTVLLFLVILVGPLFGIGVMVFNQSQDVYQSISSGRAVGPFLDSVAQSINDVLPAGLEFDMQEKFEGFIVSISENVARIFSNTVSAIFAFFLMLLTMFYFLKDGPHWKRALIDLSPLEDKDDRKIIERLSGAINGVIKGYLLIALLQGIFMGVGLWLFGVPNAALWGVVAGISALVPIIGTATVAIPALVYIFLTNGLVFALGFLLWSVLIVGTMDNILNPIIIGSKIKIPPLLILFSVLGGISLMGPIGILVGPLTVSLLYALVSLYKTEFRKIPK